MTATGPLPDAAKTNGSGAAITTAASGDDFDFPAPEEGVDDAFPAPDQAFSTPKPLVAPSTSAAVPPPAVHAPSVSGGDPFASDPFSFPDDNAFGAAAPPAAGEAAAPSTAPKGSGFDDFDASAFDKF
jgi:hypothetical protein